VHTDCTTPTIDWAAVERAAAKCGPRTRRLAATHDREALADWLRWACENATAVAAWAAYVELSDVIGTAPRLRGVGDIDHNGDVA
jgi:hypothetical protein